MEQRMKQQRQQRQQLEQCVENQQQQIATWRPDTKHYTNIHNINMKTHKINHKHTVHGSKKTEPIMIQNDILYNRKKIIKIVKTENLAVSIYGSRYDFISFHMIFIERVYERSFEV